MHLHVERKNCTVNACNNITFLFVMCKNMYCLHYCNVASSQAKLSGKKKLPKMALTVSTRGIRVVNMATKEVKQDVTIYRSVVFFNILFLNIFRNNPGLPNVTDVK